MKFYAVEGRSFVLLPLLITRIRKRPAAGQLHLRVPFATIHHSPFTFALAIRHSPRLERDSLDESARSITFEAAAIQLLASRLGCGVSGLHHGRGRASR